MNKIKYDVQKDIRSSGVGWYAYVLVGLVTALVGIAIVALVMTVFTLLSNNYNRALDTCISKGHSKEYCISILN